MKKFLIILLMFVTFGICVDAAGTNTAAPEPQSQSRGVSFRSTQKLRSSDGFEMYVYANHTIEMFDDQGRTAGSGTWQLKGGEFYIYANSGSLIAKCSCNVSKGELKSVTFNGSTYYKKR